MIPIVQFDPASMTIWTSVVGFEDSLKDDLNAIYRDVLQGHPIKLSVQANLGDYNKGHEAVVMASNIIHEKRHFFDALLTNCGARTFRNLFMFAANFPELAKHALDLGEPILLPIEHYCCPVQRSVFGIKEPPNDIVQLASRARDFKSMSQTLQDIFQSESVSMDLGETGQFEGLAVASQMVAVEREFGPEATLIFTKSELAKHEVGSSYRAIEAVCLALGTGKKVREDAVILNPDMAAALFVTALNGRFFGGGATAKPEATDPGSRLAQLILKFGHEDRFEVSDAKAFDLVDEASREIWGKTALEEAIIDLEGMKGFLDQMRKRNQSSNDLVAAFEDFVELRERILQRLTNEGMELALPKRFVEEWVDQIIPYQVEVQSNGIPNREHGSAAFTNDDICFGKKFYSEGGTRPSGQVIWGVLNSSNSTSSEYRMANEAAWQKMVMFHAPRARVMLNGLRHRRMQANEIDIEISRLEEHGLSFQIDPEFAEPPPMSMTDRRTQAQAILNLSGRKSAICDLTGRELSFDEVAIALPSEVRRPPLSEIREANIDNEFALSFANAVDWSDMIVDAAIFERSNSQSFV